jgi:hypothetical protein
MAAGPVFHGFHPLFDRWARRVRGRLALRQALTGAAVGLVLSVALAALGWKTRHGEVRALAPILGAAGLVAGLIAARRTRWSDEDVALYLDQRLDTEETIATAVELQNQSSDNASATRAVVVTKATAALTTGAFSKARPRLLKPIHALLPLATAGLVVLARVPLPEAKASAEPPGTTKVQIAQVEGLDKIAQLARVQARDEAQRERLDKISKDAEKLKEELLKGMEKRDAQDKIARLREAISEERLSLGNGEKRAGLESAVSKLEENDLTKRAGKALGDHDLEAVDEEMERIANEREHADRELAKKSLEQAADAAKKNGAPDVAKALEDEKKAMEKREGRSDKLRDLADAMQGTPGGDEIKSESEALDRKGSDAAAKKLAESMSKALEKLTPEERKRLAEKLKEMSKKKGATSADSQQMKDLADDLSTLEGQKKLEEQLKDMAKDDDESSESKRQKSLDDAEQGAEGAEGDIGKHGKPGENGQPGQGPKGQQGQGQQGQGQDGPQGNGQGQQGVPMPNSANGGSNGGNNKGGQKGTGGHGSHDEGTVDHRGNSGVVDANTLKSRAHGPLNKGQAMPGSITTFVPGKAGGTANTRGTGDLRVVGPSEVDGVERSDVPEEYREHVRQYFQP